MTDDYLAITGSTVTESFIWVYDMTDGSLVNTFSSSDGDGIGGIASQNDHYGYAMAIHGDTLVVGAEFKDSATRSNAGVVYIYNIVSGALTETLAQSSGGGTNRYFGSDVDITSDYIIVGAYGHNRAVVYDRNNNNAVLYNLITPTSSTFFGTNVSVHGDTLAVSAPLADVGGTNTGSIVLYDLTDGSTIRTISGTEASQVLGYDVRVVGNYVLAAASRPFTSFGGRRAVIYDIRDGSIVTANDGDGLSNNWWGAPQTGTKAVGMAFNGTHLLAGATNNNSGEGAIYLYTL